MVFCCHSRYQRTEEEDVTVTKMPPKFLGPIKGTNIIREDQKAHFEARLEPQNDPTMKVSSDNQPDVLKSPKYKTKNYLC